MTSFNSDDCDSVSCGGDVEAILRAVGRPVPSPDFRTGVLAAMEVAAEERRAMLAGQARPAPSPVPRRRVLPDLAVGLVAAVLVMVVVTKPWSVDAAGRDGGSAAPPEPPPSAAVASSTEEPPDVHRALVLLDARRELFAAAPARGLPRVDF